MSLSEILKEQDRRRQNCPDGEFLASMGFPCEVERHAHGLGIWASAIHCESRGEAQRGNLRGRDRKIPPAFAF